MKLDLVAAADAAWIAIQGGDLPVDAHNYHVSRWYDIAHAVGLRAVRGKPLDRYAREYVDLAASARAVARGPLNYR